MGVDEYLAVDYPGLTAVLLEAVKELKAESDRLRGRVTSSRDGSQRTRATGSGAATSEDRVRRSRPSTSRSPSASGPSRRLQCRCT